MKRFLFFVYLGLFSCVAQAQYTTVANESFTTTIPSGWSASPTRAWVINNSLAVSSPTSVLGFVPNSNGDSVELITSWYDLSNYAHVFLQFSQICKVTGSDLSQIKYQELAMPGWKTLPTSSYQGADPTAYAGAKFSQHSYSTWQPNDSLATPSNSWWREESFDISGEVSYAQVRFKFIIKKGNVTGSQFAYGWVIDNFKLLASANPIQPPVVEFLTSSPIDTVYNTGPFTVTAKIATRTYAQIVQPVKLNVSYKYNNITTYDTITMTMVEGDSIFSAIIPQKVFGTTITYDVRGVDSVGNDASAYSGFSIKRLGGGSNPTNSVALYRIDNPTDSVVAAPAHQVPVVVTIKNKGIGDLDSCLIDWTLNGVPQPTYTWYGHLSSDFNAMDTIGYYTHSVNKYDTLIIWTSMPNGVDDSMAFDDTLMRVSFGIPDLVMRFTTNLSDTVYNTGPFEIVAEIYSRVGANLPSIINLNAIYINDTVHSYDTLFMTAMGNNLYKTIISQRSFGTDVLYSITLTHALGNVANINDRFYIKRIGCVGGPLIDSVIVGLSGAYQNNYWHPFNANANYSWSRSLYMANDLGNNTIARFIARFGWYNSYNNFSQNYVYTRDLKIYMKATNDVSVSSAAYVHPIMDGATLIYDGQLTTSLYWNAIDLQVPFLLLPNQNLLIYVEDSTGLWISPYIIWTQIGTSYVSTCRGYTGMNGSSNNAGNLTSIIPITLFGFVSLRNDSSSVALHSIVNPNSSVIAGQPTPVAIIIKNKGITNLTSCKINFTLNGVLQPIYNWKGNLQGEFNSTDTIGYYTPRKLSFDTLVVWVSYPNGAYDSISYDDTVEIITFACGQALAGDIIVGSDTSISDFIVLTELLEAIKICGISGNVTAKLQSGVYNENIIIDDFTAVMGTDTLFITSLAGNADSVVIQAPSGVALTLNNVKNLYISNVTLNASLGTYGIQFVGAGDNIEIYGCKIKANPMSTSNSNAGVYYGNSNASGKYLTNVRFIKNTISGGYYNMFFYYSGSGTVTMGLSSITIDSNTLTDAYRYGIYSYYYGNYPSISYNSITSRVNTPSEYYGIYTYYYHNILELVGNKIIVKGTNTCYGMYLYYYHNYSIDYGSTGPGLLSNNEIIVLGGNTTAYGIYMYENSRWDMIHNTIYVQATGICYGLYRHNTTMGYRMNVNRNILVTRTMSTGYPLYISSKTYVPSVYGTINYNNYYSSGPYIAYVGSDISNIAAMKVATTQDTNSINIKPNFIDSTSNLGMLNYTGFDCPRDSMVLVDINNYPRLTTTTIGAHSLMFLSINAKMKEVVGWETQAMVGRNFRVVSVLENAGLMNLTSATINWSFNNVLKTPVNWTGNLATSQSATVYLGNVAFLQGNNNNLVVWVTNPNNTTDMYPANDTLRLSSLGGAGVLIEFISPYFVDTLAGNIGPYEINARVKSLSQQPLLTPPVLNVYTLWQGTPTYASITMTAVSNGLWKATIPQKAYGSYVEYSITAYDSLGAMATDTAWFYVKRGTGGSDNNSVALTHIINPTDTVPCFQAIPIRVIIKNKGIKNLTSCNIEWSRNGTPQPTYLWAGVLPEDFIDTVVIGNYTPSFGVTENFKIWVSQPNGVLDPVNYDDTLTIGAYGYYNGGNVVAKAILEPANIGARCFENKTALKVTLENVGTRFIMFSTHPITFYYRISGAITMQGSVTFNSGVFRLGEKEFILDSIDVRIPGTYYIDLYFYCDDDVVHTDDTLRMIYDVNKIAMPYDNTFSNATNDYRIAKSGSIGWKLNANPAISPVFGTGALHMGSGAGETSTLSFYSINMVGSSYPTLEFWFAHTNLNSSLQDRIVVKISTDGGLSFSTLQTVYRYKGSAFTPVWGKYILDLLNYSSQPCLIIAIEAISAGGGDMWIDRIKINSNHEIALTDLDVQKLKDLVACDLSNKPLSVTISNNVNQLIDFTEIPVTINIEVSGAVSRTYSHMLTTGGIAAHSQSSYEVESDFDYSTTGTYLFRAYINSVDRFPNNDTITTSLTINPDVSIDSIVDIACEVIGVSAYKKVFIKNEGNISAANIPLRLQIDGAGDIVETAGITLLPGQRKSYTFTTPYTVPAKTDYALSVMTEMSCDAKSSNDTLTISCCVIEPFVKVKAIIYPASTPCGLANTKKHALVTFENTDSNPIVNQVVYLEVDDKTGNVVTIKDTLLYMPVGTMNYRFVKPYTVPNLAEGATYTLTSYVYAAIYGVSVEACVTTVGVQETSGKSWYLGQNIPNPAMTNTLIPYSIPKDGKITFKVMSISGQVLYYESIQASSGSHYVELNTQKIANGIYYYSMEYEGQNIVKKMTIQK